MVGVVGYVRVKRGALALPNFPTNLSQVASLVPIDTKVLGDFKENANVSQLGPKLSETLDSLVTHPGKNGGPMVLGVKVSNNTIGTITDILMGLPSEQLNQVKSVVCATSSAKIAP